MIMRVRDVMTPDPVTVRTQTTLQDAQARMIAANCRRLPVVTEEGHICGIVTDRDLRLVVNSPLILRERWQDEMLMQHTTVDACMTPDPICIAPDAPLEDAINLLLANRISGLPVIEHDQVVGVISVTDLMRTLARLLGGVKSDADERG
jgi:acetoin utilization protein AcuB